MSGFAVIVSFAVVLITLPSWSSLDVQPAARGEHPLTILALPVEPGLPAPGPLTRNPVNAIDRFSGKPILPSSPTITYKGYVVAFCCNYSPGYTGGWNQLTEAEKDTYVRGFISPPAEPQR